MIIQLSVVLLCCSQMYGSQNGVKEQFAWSILDFKFPNESIRLTALSSGSYIPQNNDLNAVRVWNDKVFVSVFRLKVGVASSFNYFPIDCGTKSPLLIPYPSFDANYISKEAIRKSSSLPCDSSIINTAYFQIDKCDRLWVADAGILDYFGDRVAWAPPGIVIIDLKTNTLIRRYRIPEAFVNSHSGFISLDVDLNGNGCDNAFAYIVDLYESVIVYSFETNRSWRLTHHFLRPEHQAAYFHYGGVYFYWNFGIIGITVGGLHHDGSRRVYLKTYSSTKAYQISNKILQNETYIALNNPHCDVHFLGDRGKNGQIYSMAYDEKTNVLFDAQFIKKRVGCWNTANPYKNSSFGVVYKSKKLFFPVDVSVDRNRNLWMLSNNFPLFAHEPWEKYSNIQRKRG